MHHATVAAAEIKLDIMKGCFDATLKKYKPSTIDKPVALQANISQSAISYSMPPVFLNNLVLNFNDWCKNIRNVDVDNSIDYWYTRRLLEKWVNVPIIQTAQKLNGEQLLHTIDGLFI